MGKKVISNDEILTKVDNFLKELDNDRANKTKKHIFKVVISTSL